MTSLPVDVVVFPPVNTLPDAQFVQANTKTAIKGFKVFDGDSLLLTTTLAVEHGTLTIGSAGSAAVSGNGTGAVQLTGTIDDINAALTATDNLTYRGHTDFFGADTLTMTTTDNGHAGIGPQSDTDQVGINVGTWLTGTPGRDTFESLPGASRIDAHGGNDIITFNFKLVDATVTYDNNAVIIDGPSSHTVLAGFERFVFTDGTVDNAHGSRLVDDLFYYARNHDVWNAHVDAEQHYNQFGWHEGRDPSAFFSTSSYLSNYTDVAAAGVNPLTHYEIFGWQEGRVPSHAFDPAQYLAAYPDVAAAHVDPLLHYLQFGIYEGRSAFPEAVL
jgi:hypothetical protein